MLASFSGSVAQPLYRTFLQRAESAHRQGEEVRALELFHLALDVAPEEVRPMVVVAAGPYLAATGGAAAGGHSRARPVDAPRPEPEPLSYPMPLIPVEPPAVERLPLVVTQAPRVQSSMAAGAPPVGARATRGAAKKKGGALQTVFAVSFLAASLYGFQAIALPMLGIDPPLPALSVPGLPSVGGGGTGSVAAAHQRLAAGDAAGALASLPAKPAPREAGEAGRVRALAYEKMGDDASAADAWVHAASQDPGTGSLALEAGQWLEARGLTEQAAEAYLYAVVPGRTPEEIERIAAVQEKAGHPERAKRVRAGL